MVSYILQCAPVAFGWRREDHEAQEEAGGTVGGAATVGRKVEPWRKCGDHSITFMKDMYFKKNSKHLTTNRTGKMNVEKVVVPCLGCGHVF